VVAAFVLISGIAAGFCGSIRKDRIADASLESIRRIFGVKAWVTINNGLRPAAAFRGAQQGAIKVDGRFA
jgi:hypothetical protein